MAYTDDQLVEYIKTFSNKTNGDVKRELFVIFGKKGTEGTYEPLGYKQESASIANNYESEEITDVLGDTYSELTGKKESIEMSEYHCNKEHSKFLDEAHMLTQAGLENQMGDYSLLMVSAWLTDSSGKMFAREVENCTLRLDNAGGQEYMMADVTFTGISRGKIGTVDSLEAPKFTEYLPA